MFWRHFNKFSHSQKIKFLGKNHEITKCGNLLVDSIQFSQFNSNSIRISIQKRSMLYFPIYAKICFIFSFFVRKSGPLPHTFSVQHCVALNEPKKSKFMLNRRSLQQIQDPFLIKEKYNHSQGLGGMCIKLDWPMGPRRLSISCSSPSAKFGSGRKLDRPSGSRLSISCSRPSAKLGSGSS